MKKTGKQRVYLRLILALLVILGGIVGTTLALSNTSKAEEVRDPRKTVIIKVAFCPLDGFFEYDGNGEECGYGVDYLEELKKYENIEWEYVPVDSWEAIKDMMMEGTVDVRMPVSEVVNQKASYSEYSTEPLLWTYHALLTKNTRDDLYYEDFDTFKKLKIGISRSLLDKQGLTEHLKEIGVYKNLIYYDDYNTCKEDLDNGKLDIVVSNVMDLTEDLKVLDKFCVSKTYITTLKGSDKYDIIDSAMTKLTLENPSFQTELNNKYFPERNLEPYTKEETAFMKNTHQLTVAIYPNRQPVSYYDEKTKTYKGIAVDIANLLSAKIGIKFKYIPVDTESNKVMLKKADLVMPVPGESDNSRYFVSKSILNSEIMMVVRDGDGEPGADSRVAVLKETAGIRNTVQKNGRYTIVEYDTNDQALKAVQNGEVAAFANASYVVNWLIENPRYSGLRVLRYQGFPLDYAICGKAEDTILKSVIAKGITRITENETNQIIASNTSFTMEDLSWNDKLYAYRYEIMTVAVVFFIFMILVLIYNHTRTVYMKEIKKRGEEQARANRAKSDFLSRMSHDMRTPMNGILGLTYIMEDQTGDETILEELKQQRSSGEYLLQLINDVLDVNKVENDDFVLHPSRCDEKATFDSIINLVTPQMDEKNIDFHFVTHNIDWCYLMIDIQRVKQVFVNLLGNATKFTPEGGRIDFIMELVSKDDTEVYDKFTIRDTGIGMKEEFIPKVFEPFAQEHRAEKSLDGTGLGLSIVKNIVELMGGNISVQSKENEGTEFTLFLHFPRAKDEERQGEKAPAKISDKILPEHINILLCEDHPLNAQIAMQLLKKQGCEVTWRENGKLGVDEFVSSKEGTYDMILMDIRMPEMDGLEAAAAIRSLDREDAKNIPIIAMTANAYAEDVEKSMEAGMNAHIAKPIVPKVLYETIASSIKCK